MTTRKKPRPAARGTGEIKADAVYSKAEFLARTGIGDAGFTTAKKNGLRVYHAGGRVHVIGADWIAYLQTQPQNPPGPSSNVRAETECP